MTHRPPGQSDGEVVPLASPLPRLTGYLLDQAVLGVLVVPALHYAAIQEAAQRAGAGVFLSALSWTGLVAFVYHVIPTALWGVTPGKLYAGTRVIAPDGSVPGWWRSTLRALVGSLAELVANLLVLGILDPAWLLWDPRRQTLHDKAAGTLVIRAKARRPLPAFVVSLLLALAVQVGLVFAVIRPLIVQAYYVPSGSMLPTLRKHDRLLVNKLSYRYGRLQRGDVIVFVAPKAALLSNPEANPDPNEKKDFIKRLIALPGDTVKVEDGRLWLREKGQSQLHTVEEPYVAAAPIYAFGPVTVPEGHVLVFGDNRNNSNDSTKWLLPTGGGTEPAPFLPIANIRGRAFFRYWPLTSFGDLPSADNFDSR